MRARRPAHLGADFAKLWTAAAVSNVGDGVTVAAGPLLVASLTDDSALVAGAAFALQLPWLLLALLSGTVADRVDRQRLIVTVNLFRCAVVGALAAAVLAGLASIPLVYAAFFLLGAGETLADTAAAARLPGIVPADRLAAANARLGGAFTIGNQFAAKPLGASLFVVAAALPFGFDALTFLAAAVLVAAMRPAPPPSPRPRSSVPADVAEGLRWLLTGTSRAQRLLRTLAVSMGAGNIAFCAAFAVFVLYARQRLGLSEVGYGYLLTTFAVGGLLGTAAASRLRARFGASVLLRAGLVIEAVTHITLARTTHAWLAAGIIVVFGIHAMVWGVIATTLIQQHVPDHLLGRVKSVSMLLEVGGAALGSLLGGAIAQSLGVTAPYWAAGAVMVLVAAAAWRPLRQAAAA